MIIKSPSLLYLFDFDGTISGTDDWKGFFSNAKACFQRLHFNPNKLDIRWCILTSRPRMDRAFVNLVCVYYNLDPKEIFTGPTFTWKFKNKDEIANYKASVIKSILNQQIKMSYTPIKIEKVIYVDNDPEITIPINSIRDGYQYIAVSVSDLLKNNYHEIIL